MAARWRDRMLGLRRLDCRRRDDEQRRTWGHSNTVTLARARGGTSLRCLGARRGDRSGARDRSRAMDVSGRRCVAHPVYAGRADHSLELRGSGDRVAVECGQLWSQHGTSHAHLCRRQADHRQWQPPPRGRPRPGDRRAAVELHRAQHQSLRVLDAQGLWKGHRLHRDRRPGGGLDHEPRLLPARARRRDRPAARELGTSGAGTPTSAPAGRWTWWRI